MGQCLWGSGKCFKCGASDHMLRDCPQWRQPAQGRVFVMHAEEANPDTTLLTENIFLKIVATKALLNSGVTHSFISETFANYLDVKSIELDVSYSVTVPSVEELSATSVARKLMHKGCQAFLASVISIPDAPTPAISDVPLVRDFSDVFPDDVTSLPPERKVEFAIDLVPNTMPISNAPYHLTPAEMLELKQQIQKLLDKEYIRPSFSL
ncbi:uncharacterized protein [Primulina huaijiensis]|uniref:uncharacterized protein n=1 Tax=Primulina huaijiensis TaxID=1492673 RepID=UPI003CC79105